MGRAELVLTDFFYNIDIKLKQNKIYRSLMMSFEGLYPFVLMGSILMTLRISFFSGRGFLYQIYGLPKDIKWIIITNDLIHALENVTLNVISLLLALLVTHHLAHLLKIDDQITPIISVASFLLINYNWDQVLSPTPRPNNNSLSFFLNSFGMRGIFIGMVIGIFVAYSYFFLEKLWSLIFKNYGFTHRFTLASLILLIILATSYLLNYLDSGGLTDIFYGLLDIPIDKRGRVSLSILLITFATNLLGWMGISSALTPLTSNQTTPTAVDNLSAALTSGSVSHLPYPINYHTLYDPYAAYGGNGMTLALIIALFLFSKQYRLKRRALENFIPGIFGINSGLLFGIPVLFNVTFLLPILITPLFGIAVAYVFIRFGWMIPSIYNTPPSTPGFLQAYLGTNGDINALVAAIIVLVGSVIIYLPFVRIYDNIMIREAQADEK